MQVGVGGRCERFEDQRGPPVGQHRHPGVAGQPAQSTGQRLHDRLDVVADRVDDQAVYPLEAIDDHDRQGSVGGTGRGLQVGCEIDQRQQGVPVTQEAGRTDGPDPVVELGGGDVDDRLDVGLRDGVAATGTGDDDGREDRQGQRYVDPEGGAHPGFGPQIDTVPDLLEVGSHHIHPDAASRDGGHLLGCGHPGQEQQGQPFHLAQGGGALLTQLTHGDRPGDQALA